MNYRALYERAHTAGMAAGKAAVPTPMVVGTPTDLFGDTIDYSKKTWYVPDGVCGFAWVAFAGNTAWGRWAKKAGVASKHYPKGLSVWVSEFGQSMARKEAYAYAFSRVLNEAGIKAYAGSRMD